MSNTKLGQQKNCLGFGSVKMIKFPTLPMISYVFGAYLSSAKRLGPSGWVSIKNKQLYFYWQTQMYIFDYQKNIYIYL